jgi:hypothetical protein
MSLRTFVENVVVLAVENQLMRDMSNIFTVKQVLSFDDATLQRLAAEPEEVREKRKRLEAELKTLRAGLATLQDFKRSTHICA